MALTVCGLIGSPFYRKVCTLLDEKSIQYDTEVLNPFQADETFTKVNPMRRVPLLKDSDVSPDFILPDSSAIVQYIEKKHPSNSLFPKDLAEYGRALWIEEYADTELAGAIGLKVFRPVVFPQLAGQEPDMEAALDAIRHKLPIIHDYLENELEGREWFAGDSFGIADISVAVHYGNLAFAGYIPSPTRWPNLAAFMRRVGSKESFTNLHIKAATIFANINQITIDPSEGL